jgi:uncharacterized SAM-binding protein YcdF (DUF218 family)
MNTTDSAPARSSITRIGSQIVVLILIALAVFLIVGIVRFFVVVTSYESSVGAQADAIVVLTGGKSRINAGMQLLQMRQAKRMLISGVHRDTSAKAIFDRFLEYRDLNSCCIDIDRIAVNTAQNARETAKWMNHNGFKSLIVVTSDYHMPRALLEMKRAMPDIVLVPHAVGPVPIPGKAGIDISEQTKMIVREYFKTMVSSLNLLGRRSQQEEK